VLCPKCNFTTFEHADVCKKCGYDLKAYKESKGIKAHKPVIKSETPPQPQGDAGDAISSEPKAESLQQAKANNQPMPYDGSSKDVGSKNSLERREQNMQQTGTITVSQEGSPVAGFFILIAAFFSMPIKTLKITIQELREVGNKGKLDVAATDIPHLTWLHIAGHLFISIIVVVIVVLGILGGLYSLKGIRYSPTGAIGGLILYPLGGAFAAILADWFMAIGLELLGLWSGMANDIKKISQR
jgi:hypothetical protein